MPFGRLKAGLALAAIGLLAAAPAPVDLGTLAVLSSVKPGLWDHSFTTAPKNPGVPDQQERGCVSQAELAEMIRQAARTEGQDEQCPMTVESNGVSKAAFTLHCSVISIPQLGIEAPAVAMPATIEKTQGQDHWVVSVSTPAVPGITPAAIWRHDYRRLGDCPK